MVQICLEALRENVAIVLVFETEKGLPSMFLSIASCQIEVGQPIYGRLLD